VFPSHALVREIAAEFDPRAEGSDAYRIPIELAALDPAGFSLCRSLVRRLPEERDEVRVTEELHGLLRAVVSSAYPGRTGSSPQGRVATRRAHDAVVEDAKEAMTSRFAEGVTVEELAASIHVSPYHLTRVFRRQTGFGLHEYIDQLRVRAAFERILDGPGDLARLAFELGFSSHSHLSANFRRAFGVPPSRARSTAGAAAVGAARLGPPQRTRIW
jgi:transcriptional regulator GlxA family with amidase domain